MPKLTRQISLVLAFVAVILLYASLLVLFIVFLRDVKMGTQFASMWKGIVAFLPGAAISAFIFRGLIQRSKQGGSVSHIVMSWLADEPLLLTFVWIFVAVELVTLSYFAPIYALSVAVVGTPSTPLGERLRVVTDPGDVPFNTESRSPERAVFRSTRAFKWGDSVRVRTVEARGYTEATFRVQWPGYAPFHVFDAVMLPELQLRPDEVELVLQAPDAVAITYRWGQHSGSVHGTERVRLPRNTTVHVIAGGGDYETVQMTVSASKDTTLDLSTIKMAAGKLRISAFNEGGGAQHDLNVIVEGSAESFSVDQWIALTPGTYRVRLERVWPNQIYFAGPFSIRVRARESRDCRVEFTVRAANTPAPARGGSSPCSI